MQNCFIRDAHNLVIQVGVKGECELLGVSLNNPLFKGMIKIGKFAIKN